MTENNRQQAFLPQNSILIENPVGTAPSFIIETEQGVVISLPGVPREMKYLVTEAVLPYLLRQYQLGIIVARILRTAGIGESSLDDKIGADILRESNPSVGLAAHHGSVDVRVTAKADSMAKALKLLDTMQARLNARIGEHIFGIDDTTLEDVVQEQLKRHNLRVHVIEAGLPGVITGAGQAGNNSFTATAYKDPLEVYSDYGVDPGNVPLREFVVELAERIRVSENADASVVVLSYPDLDENADVEQGSAIAIASSEGTRYRVYGFGARSNLAREWLSRWGLANLWRLIKEQYGE